VLDTLHPSWDETPVMSIELDGELYAVEMCSGEGEVRISKAPQ